MRPRRRLATVAVLGLLGAGAADLVHAPSVGAAEVPSAAKASFIQQGDSVCEAGQKRLAAVVGNYESRRQGGSTGSRKVATPSDVARYVTEVAADEIARQLKDLSALKPPAQDAAEVKKMLDGARTALATVRKKPADAAFDNPFGTVAKQFSAYGFTACGSNNLPVAATVGTK